MTLPRWSWLAGSCLLTACFSAWSSQTPLPVQRLSAGMYIIQAEVADSPAELQQGLMFRTELAENSGMLFVFPQRNTQCMWMRNTLVPLSVAFLRDDGTVVNIADMTPRSEVSHCSSEPVRLALEMNQGWFARRGISVGTQIKGLPAQP